ncbi:FecR domain-containing protein [Herminiimonas glaciei]|uniref:FecR domain-containing protein n=1 Tax=Herminiimonas glaciei TaxID=523788 RepID=A0ABW2ID62_9BURK
MISTTFNADDSRPIDRAIAREAAQWLASLYDGQSEDDIAACKRWRAADPEHERAWQRAQRINQKFGIVPKAVGLPTLGRKIRLDRRRAIKTLLVLMMAAPIGYVSYRHTPWAAMSADYRTAKGEHREIQLADGTYVHLGTATSIDIEFDGAQRLLRLHAGEIEVTTGSDSGHPAYRPFIVQTTHGHIRALGTRFVVRRDEDATMTRVSVLEHAVEIRPQAANGKLIVLNAGQQTRFSESGFEPVEALDPHVTDWTKGVLFASRMRLEEFAAELNRYRPGLLRCDPAVAGLRITGAFQLDNTDNILNALPDTLPVEVLFRTRYWVTIVPPAKES